VVTRSLPRCRITTLRFTGSAHLPKTAIILLLIETNAPVSSSLLDRGEENFFVTVQSCIKTVGYVIARSVLCDEAIPKWSIWPDKLGDCFARKRLAMTWLSSYIFSLLIWLGGDVYLHLEIFQVQPLRVVSRIRIAGWIKVARCSASNSSFSELPYPPSLKSIPTPARVFRALSVSASSVLSSVLFGATCTW